MFSQLVRRRLHKTLTQESKKCCSKHTASCSRHSPSSPNSVDPGTRHLHYYMQRDTDKRIPENQVFIRTPDTPPILSCLNYKECTEKLREIDEQLVTANFVVNAVREEGIAKMRNFRGTLLLPTKLISTSILAICDVDQHEGALETGANLCLTTDQLDKLNSGEINLDDYDVVVCTPKALTELRSLGRILKNKMPHERKGTVSANIKSAIRHSLYLIEWETEESTNHPNYFNIRVPIARSDHEDSRLEENVTLLFDEIMKVKPPKQDVARFIERVELTAPSLSEPLHVDIRHHQHKHEQTEIKVVQKTYTREETWELRSASQSKQGKIRDERDKISRSLSDRWDQLVDEYKQ